MYRHVRNILLIVMLGLIGQQLYAYSSGTKVITRNSRLQSISNLSSVDTKVLVEVSAIFCVNNDYSNGEYSFEVKVISPKGRVSYSKTSETFSIQGSGQTVTYTFDIPIKSMSDGLGIYKIKGIYREKFTSASNTDVAQKSLLYSTQDFTSQLQRTRLAYPEDKSQIDNVLPIFRWQPPSPIIDTKYSIWVSENKNPLLNPVYTKKGIQSLRHRYPVSAQSLKFGKTYYWQVQALDENNQPLGLHAVIEACRQQQPISTKRVPSRLQLRMAISSQSIRLLFQEN